MWRRPRDKKNRAATLVKTASTKFHSVASMINKLAPTAVAEKKKGTRKAGKEYFQACIMARKGFPPVTAAAAEGERPTGGETSDRTAK